jgi:hypothetical protein
VMRIIRFTVAIAILAVISGCALPGPQVYYSSYPDYASPYPEDSPPSPELYGSPYQYGSPYAYGYYGGPYAGVYPGYWASSSSVCRDRGRRIPCPGGAP